MRIEIHEAFRPVKAAVQGLGMPSGQEAPLSGSCRACAWFITRFRVWGREVKLIFHGDRNIVSIVPKSTDSPLLVVAIQIIPVMKT